MKCTRGLLYVSCCSLDVESVGAEVGLAEPLSTQLRQDSVVEHVDIEHSRPRERWLAATWQRFSGYCFTPP